MDQNHLNNFERGPTKDHSCEDWSKSNQWFKEEMSFEEIVYGRTYARRTKCDHKSSPCHYVTGELKMAEMYQVYQFPLYLTSNYRTHRQRCCSWWINVIFFLFLHANIIMLWPCGYSSEEPKWRPEVIKLFSCSTQLSMKFSLLINMKMPTIVGIFIFISREIFTLSCLARKNLQLLVIWD